MSHPLVLFDDPPDLAPPAINPATFGGATVHELDADSSIVHVRGLITGHDELVRHLSTLAGWERRRRWMYNREVDEPRLTCEYRDLSSAPAFLVEVGAALSWYCGVRYDGLWMNWYRDHHDSTSWHADRPANTQETAVVPVVSLGAARRFLIRRSEGGPSTSFAPAGGDVLIMRGRCQRDWLHSVPKQQSATGPRMSLNFSSTAQVMGQK
ncbi:alkylated DNA repair dioxygenase AlkB [Mycolicibacterium sp. BK634]|uniref:alpha-ketoglutarate-dependent dioxygenase AlkB n=1 Tax=Mycolicibacterium sp. BK634 TaxID=2587099 RepID=UPI00160A3948|nr:alpha-ketoglutarate-dependent dioxygenase AlkB [Mycolicibacterium sp. BK634]MBB3751660.1 alkylated DNA repair dioxygenase AlkB [Mycolicibacterium sp. BK634]